MGTCTNMYNCNSTIFNGEYYLSFLKMTSMLPIILMAVIVAMACTSQGLPFPEDIPSDMEKAVLVNRPDLHVMVSLNLSTYKLTWL